MADPTLEEESLISQDDIDKLMESSSIEEAEDGISDDGPGDMDDLGELSQDDIDRLMNSNVEQAEDPLEESDIDDDDMELISQNDIDQLMNSEAPEEEAGVVEEDIVEDEPEEDFGELSQDDIDSLMNSTAPAAEENKPEEPAEKLVEENLDEDEELDEDFEMISQDDINSLMDQTDLPDSSDQGLEESGNGDDPEQDILTEDSLDETPEEPESEEPEGVVAEPDPELEKVPEENSPEGPDLKSFDEDYVIDESEAVDVQDALINQETIDDLINNFDADPIPEPDPEPVVLDEEPVSDVEPDLPEEESVEKDEPDDVAEDDDEDFLKPSSDMKVLDLDGEGDDDVSQEDIDALLLDEEGEDEDDILISQDDIDTLLMAADQEDEDVLGDLMDEEVEDDFDGDLDDDLEDELDGDFDMEDFDEDEDILESDSFEEDDEDQVVLEGIDETQAVRPKKKTAKAKAKGSKWYKSKLVVAGISALIVLGITVPVSYFIFFSKEPVQPEQPSYQPVPQLATQTHRDIDIETVDIDLKAPQMEFQKRGNLVLQDFVILASDFSKEVTYITADISIDYSDQRAYHEINNNISFYRDLIYDSINKSLVSEKRDEVTEADILWIVETTLKKVLPGQYIDRVTFKSFSAS